MAGPIEFILAGVLVGFCVGVTGVGGGSLHDAYFNQPL